MASHQAKSMVLFDVDSEARFAATIDASLVLDGDKPRLIDQWQEVPDIWNHVRRAIDSNEGPFILTGSAVPTDGVTRHTGASRFYLLRMRPMLLFELGWSNGAASLDNLLNGEHSNFQAGELTIPNSSISPALVVGPHTLDVA